MRESGSPLWLRVFAALLFVFHVHYLPFHLVAESHCHDVSAPAAVTGSHPMERGVEADDAHSDHHRPHPALDHSIQLARQTWAGFVALDVVATDTRVQQDQPQSRSRLFLVERQNPPGIFPPDPSQPRAPPPA